MYKKVLSTIIVISIAMSIMTNVCAVGDNRSLYKSSRLDYSIATDEEDIFMTKDGDYAMRIQSDRGIVNIPVGKVDFNLLDEKSFGEILNNPNIAPEIKRKLRARRGLFLNAKLTSVMASIYSTELLNTTRGESLDPIYYTYNGHEMRSDRVKYTGLNTGYKRVKNGVTTQDIADTIKNIVITTASVANNTLGFFTSGISLFKSFCDTYGENWATGSTDDFCEVCLIYNNTDQWTYVRDVAGDWHYGLFAQKGKVTNIASQQYYYNGSAGRTYRKDRDTNKTFASKHYSSPWATAYNYMFNPKIEDVKWKCKGITIDF